MLYLDALPIASLCMPAPLAVTQETCRGSDVSALNFTVHGSPSYGGTPVVIFSYCPWLSIRKLIYNIGNNTLKAPFAIISARGFFYNALDLYHFKFERLK